MVSRALLPLSLLSTASAFQIAETQGHVDYDGMKTAMVSMAKKAGKSGIDTATITAVQGFLDTLTDDLIPALDEDRKHSQTILDSANGVITTCNTDRATWVSTTFDGLNTAVSGDQGAHNSCRAAELTSKNKVVTDCDIMDTRVCSWTVCTMPDFSNGDSEAVYTYMDCLDDFFEDHNASYYSERLTCLGTMNTHHAKVTECDGLQEEFEDEFCARETAVQQRCAAYDGCRCAAEKEFEEMKTQVSDLEAIFQTQFVALKHLVCYGQQILNNSTDLSVCDEIGNTVGSSGDDCEAHYPTECPQIVYPEPVAFTDCSEPYGNFPCETNFLNEFESQYDASCTPTNACQACTAVDTLDRVWQGGRHTSYGSCALG